MRSEIVSGFGACKTLDQEWDDLCHASHYSVAASQAEVLATFQANFEPRKRMLSVLVRENSGRLIAGLPLIASSRTSLRTTVTSVSNEWCQCGQLLLRPDVDREDALRSMLEGMARLRANCMWLDWIPVQRPEWQSLIQNARAAGWALQVKPKFDVGVTRLPATWEAFEASLSRNTRKHCRSELKRLTDLGAVELEVISHASPSAVAAAVKTAMDIEMRSWKGPCGSAVASQPSTRAFFLNMAQILNRTGHFRLFLLKYNGQPIAFDMGERLGACYRSWKVSYRQDHAEYSPGHLLNQLVVKHFIADPEVVVCDSVGPLTQANRRWSNDQYQIGRLVLAPGSWLGNVSGRALLSTMKARDKWVRRNDDSANTCSTVVQ